MHLRKKQTAHHLATFHILDILVKSIDFFLLLLETFLLSLSPCAVNFFLLAQAEGRTPQRACAKPNPGLRNLDTSHL